MSVWGPMLLPRAATNLRVIRRFSSTEGGRVAGDASLGAAERDVGEGALPGHPRGERHHLVLVDGRVESDATLAWPTHRVVQHPVSPEGANMTGVNDHGESDGNRLLGGYQPVGEAIPGLDIIYVCQGGVVLRPGDRVDVQGLFGHRSSVCVRSGIVRPGGAAAQGTSARGYPYRVPAAPEEAVLKGAAVTPRNTRLARRGGSSAGVGSRGVWLLGPGAPASPTM